MNLKDVTRIETHDSHFVVHTAKGKPFQVAKAGLSDKTLGTLLALRAHLEQQTPEPVQEFNVGGGVASPEEVLAVGAAGTLPVPGTELDALGVARKTSDFFVNDFDSATDPIPGAVDTPFIAPAPLDQFASAPVPQVEAISPQPEVLPLEASDAPESLENVTRIEPEPAPRPAIPTPPARDSTSAFTAAINEQVAAIKATGEAKAAHDQEVARTLQDQQTVLGELQVERERKLKENETEYDKALEEYRRKTINPGRLLDGGHRDVFGIKGFHVNNRVLAAISIAFGSVGAALARTPNYALQIVMDAIDDDIDAQKNDLLKDRDTLAQLRQRGIDIDAAFDRKRADVLAQASAYIELQAAKLGSQTAMLAAQEAAARLKASAVETLNDLAMKDLEIRYKPLILNAQLREHEAREKAAQSQHELNQRELTLKELQANQTLDRQEAARHVLQALHAGPVRLTPEMRSLLDEAKRGDEVVDLADGTSRLAAGTEAAKEVRKTQAVFNDVLASIKELEEIRQRHPRGHFGVTDAGRADKARAKALLEGLKVKVAKMHEPTGVLTDTDLERYAKLVPDITDYSLIAPDVKASQLVTLQSLLENKRLAVENAMLRGSQTQMGYPPIGAPSSAAPAAGGMVRVKQKATGMLGTMPRAKYEARASEFDLVE